jgi:hypothetical protein
MSEEILERQIEILEEKLQEIREGKKKVVAEQKYEQAAKHRDLERETMEKLYEKDPGNEVVLSDTYYMERFLQEGDKLNYIQELAKDGTITVKYRLQMSSMVEYGEGVSENICERFNLSRKEWLALCKEYNKVNVEEKIFSIDPEEGGTMKEFEIAISARKKNE